MRYLVLVTDYDGTIATRGQVEPAALAAIERLRESGRRAILLTGRRLDDLLSAFPRPRLCRLCCGRRRGDYSRWFREAVRDPYLADQAERIEQRQDLRPRESRDLIRSFIEARYTLPE